jgi:quercetin dioxygenase-like cupin family protein
LRNGSNKALDVTVTANNATTGHQSVAHVALAPFHTEQLSASQFEVEPGDHLTLHSPPFADREFDPPNH